MRWCVSNAVADVDGNGNIRPSKETLARANRRREALVTSPDRVLVTQTGSIYERKPRS
jgi:hypothetical protein